MKNMDIYKEQISKDNPEIILEGSNPYRDLKDGNTKAIKARMNKVIDLLIDGESLSKSDAAYFKFFSDSIKTNK